MLLTILCAAVVAWELRFLRKIGQVHAYNRQSVKYLHNVVIQTPLHGQNMQEVFRLVALIVAPTSFSH